VSTAAPLLLPLAVSTVAEYTAPGLWDLRTAPQPPSDDAGAGRVVVMRMGEAAAAAVEAGDNALLLRALVEGVAVAAQAVGTRFASHVQVCWKARAFPPPV
jgi:hypothetical protein